MSVEIFPFVVFGGIAVLAVVGIFSFRSRPDQSRTMQRVRAGCWVALVIAALGAIAYIVVPARTPGP